VVFPATHLLGMDVRMAALATTLLIEVVATRVAVLGATHFDLVALVFTVLARAVLVVAVLTLTARACITVAAALRLALARAV
jgi:uncharacterized membrane protein YuzA (DUF378 family)